MTQELSKQPRAVFGPVLSGRLGRSLGLDLLGARICSFDCLYCECGRTSKLTLERAVYVRPENLLGELYVHRLADPSALDAVTLGGLGEPCLNSRIGDIIAGAKDIYPGVPVAILTNSSLFHDARVRQEILAADIILPSLDTMIPEEFARLNRPCPGAGLPDIASGLLALRGEFAGRIFLEVLLADAINDTAANMEVLAAFREKLKPDRVDVVTLTRPGAYPLARPATAQALARFRQALGGHGGPGSRPTGRHGPAAAVSGAEGDLESAIIASLGRRPQTAGQLAGALGAGESEVGVILSRLSNLSELQTREDLGQIFYSLTGR